MSLISSLFDILFYSSYYSYLICLSLSLSLPVVAAVFVLVPICILCERKKEVPPQFLPLY